MSSQTHHTSGTLADWLEDAALVLVLFSAVAIAATIIALLLVL